MEGYPTVDEGVVTFLKDGGGVSVSRTLLSE